MKHLKWMSIVLLAACLALPAFANGTESEKGPKNIVKRAERAIEEAALKAAKKEAGRLIKHKKHNQRCARCGEEITHEGQHCSATGSTSLCTPAEAPKQAAAQQQNQSVCNECGEELTIDERYHGVQHVCRHADEHNHCVYCGEEITHKGQHCSATGSTSLCTPAEAPKQAAAAQHNQSVCNECGEELTIDERYHGVQHACSHDEKHNHCIYCGEEIKSENQKCSASNGGAVCTTRCPECGKDLRDPKNLVNGEHRCKFKGRLTPAEPKK